MTPSLWATAKVKINLVDFGLSYHDAANVPEHFLSVDNNVLAS